MSFYLQPWKIQFNHKIPSVQLVRITTTTISNKGLLKQKQGYTQLYELWYQTRKSKDKQTDIEEQIYTSSTLMEASSIFLMYVDAEVGQKVNYTTTLG